MASYKIVSVYVIHILQIGLYHTGTCVQSYARHAQSVKVYGWCKKFKILVTLFAKNNVLPKCIGLPIPRTKIK